MQKLLIILASALFLISAPSVAHDGNHKHGITIEQPWAPHTGRRKMSAAVYFTIKNTGHNSDSLIGVHSDVANVAMLHRSYEDDGIMKMDHVEELKIPAGDTAALEPGAYHIMMMQLEKPLKRGEVFPLMLEFKKAGKVRVIVEITGIGGPE